MKAKEIYEDLKWVPGQVEELREAKIQQVIKEKGLKTKRSLALLHENKQKIESLEDREHDLMKKRKETQALQSQMMRALQEKSQSLHMAVEPRKAAHWPKEEPEWTVKF